MGSQRRQAVTDAGRPTATIGAGNWLIRRRPATVRDGPIAPEKRKVGGSTPPLTTHYHQRVSACGLRKRRCPNRLTAAPWRPFQTPGARCGPMLGARRVHGGIWLQTTGMVLLGVKLPSSTCVLMYAQDGCSAYGLLYPAAGQHDSCQSERRQDINPGVRRCLQGRYPRRPGRKGGRPDRCRRGSLILGREVCVHQEPWLVFLPGQCQSRRHRGASAAGGRGRAIAAAAGRVRTERPPQVGRARPR